MGEVYRARDTRLDRDVAVKILPAGFSNDSQLRLRFEREARTISSLSHPHICALYDIGREDGIDYLVLELLEGESLAERLAKGSLPADQVLRYGAQIADALDRAHNSGVVHRDLKPGNIMLTRSGAKLLDFGLAKDTRAIQHTVDGTVEATQQKPVTEQGTILGTFQYMAPEQLEGAPADPRTDIFSFGAVLYEMATGRRAFEGKTRTSLIAAIVSTQPPPVSRVQPLTPPALDHVIQRCLAKEPADRWQSARDIAEELKWIAREGSAAGVAAPVVARRKRREWAWMALAAVLAVTTAALAFILLRQRPQQHVMRVEIAPPTNNSIRLFGDAAGAVTISPDGRWITFEAMDEASARNLWLRPIDSLQARAVDGAQRASYPFWSPDSRSLAFFSGGKLKRVDVTGGPVSTICDAPEARGGTWSTDGTIVFAPHWRGGLFRVPAAGGKPEPLTQLDKAASETTHRFPSFLPDGKHYLYLAGTHLADAKSDLNAIYLASLESKERKLLLRARSNAAFTSGHLLFVRENYLLAQPFDHRKLTLSGEPLRLAEDVHYESGFFRAAFSAADDGTLVFAPTAGSGTVQLTWMDRSGKPLEKLGDPALVRHIRISPDGKRAVATIGDPSDLWVYDLSRGVRRRLTFEPLNEEKGIWSPDNRTIVYNSDRDVQFDLFARPADGNGPEVALLLSNDIKEPTDWSRDGRFLLFNRVPMSGDNADVWVLPMTGERKAFPLLQSPFAEAWAGFSPDGRWVLFTSNESGRDEIYATSFPTPGARQQISTAGGQGSVWIGNEIIYVAPDFTLHSVKVKVHGDTLEVSSPTALFKTDPEMFGDIAPDGQRFLMSLREKELTKRNLTLVTGWNTSL